MARRQYELGSATRITKFRRLTVAFFIGRLPVAVRTPVRLLQMAMGRDQAAGADARRAKNAGALLRVPVGWHGWGQLT